MATVALNDHLPRTSPLAAHKPSPWFNVLVVVVVAAGMIYAGYHLADDLSVVRDARAYPYVLLGIALLIALSFEFVNGFHDTANAVARVRGRVVNHAAVQIVIDLTPGAGSQFFAPGLI